jgi:hypothetical protein
MNNFLSPEPGCGGFSQKNIAGFDLSSSKAAKSNILTCCNLCPVKGEYHSIRCSSFFV